MTDHEGAMEAQDLLAELERIRHSTRQTVLTANWAMFLMWGGIFLGSVLAFSSGSEAMSAYWMVAGPAGAIASFAMGARADRGASTGGSTWPYMVTALFMFIGTFGSFYVFEVGLAVLVWWLTLVVGFGSFAWLDDQRQLLAALALLAAWGIMTYLLLTDYETLYYVLAGTMGGMLLGAGAGLRMVRR